MAALNEHPTCHHDGVNIEGAAQVEKCLQRARVEQIPPVVSWH
jgi:hypothetical protein